VLRCNGVLAHPTASLLLYAASLPHTTNLDSFGGWTMAASQCWWGHRPNKMALWYISGVEPGKLPPMPLKLAEPRQVVESWKRKDDRPDISKREGEHRPL
jgi:hypothetical protein